MTEKKSWYEELFANYADQYDKESFAQGTLGEVDFIEKEIGLDPMIRVLDVGCGTGRHAVELAVRGYAVTGVDLSENMLHKARSKAQARGVKVCFMQGDARQLPFASEFDLVIMICEGAFPLMETDAMNYEILLGIRRALAEKGKLIMTTLNALYPLVKGVPDADDMMRLKLNESEYFDLLTFRQHSPMNLADDDHKALNLIVSERFYTPAEMKWLLHTAGFAEVDIYGCTLGAFSRTEPLTPDHLEMLIVAAVTT
jgi:ubiquinone/menaquinone biosynthesis C-methylase UbiE